MAEPESQRRNESAEGGKLYTLSEISQRTGISMPTLQRYKKMYQARIPAVGQGRKQRYPDSALPVFNEIKTENAGRRGRPRKDASAPRPPRVAASKRRGRPGRPPKAAAVAAGGRPAAAQRGATGRRRGRPPGSKNVRAGGRAQKSGTSNLLTLTEISKQTGISYPTLVRYVRLHSARLPHEGRGRARRFYPQAVDVFRQLRSESGRGGRKKGSGAGRRPGRPPGSGRGRAAAEPSGGLAQRLKAIEKAQESLEKKLRVLVKNLTNLYR
jgi:predicted DNA-binding transcriptional regulator AlpA